MSTRARGVLILFLLCVAAALVTGRELFVNLSYFWGGLLVLSYLWSRYSLRGLEMERHPRTNRAQVGQLFVEQFELRNNSRLPKVWIEARDESDLPGYRVTAVAIGLGLRGPSRADAHRAINVLAGLAAHQTRNWIVRTLCTSRGRYRLGPMRLLSGDPFGLFPTLQDIPVQQHVVVLPMVVPVSSFSIPSGRLPGGEALRQRTHQITPNASGVRDYAPGDSFGRIHWRSTARLRRLVVKEFELDPLAEIWIVLDAERLVHHAYEDPGDGREIGIGEHFQLPASTFEYAATAAASLAVHFLQRDRSVGLIAYSSLRQVIQPEFGTAQQLRILESLAVANPVGGQSISDVLKIEAPRIPQGATVVIITASSDPEVVDSLRWLTHAGRQPVLVLVDDESFGGSRSSAKLAAAARLSAIPLRVIHYSDDIGAALSSRAFRPGRRRVA
jgi:uncharacterized protein (DUF58 family)